MSVRTVPHRSHPEHAPQRRSPREELAGAVERGQLFLLYQPVVELASGRFEHVEALVRWRHPVRGILAAGEFIGLAEQSGLIEEVGGWVLERTCEQLADWRREGHAVGMSVDISARQLLDAGLPGRLGELLRRHELAPGSLMLEVAEPALADECEEACERLDALRGLGVALAIDNFGTGAASLAHLRCIAGGTLKVDRTLTARLDQPGHGEEPLLAILAVARSLSLRSVAEGVEHERQLRAVAALGFEEAQGFLLGRPTPAEVIGNALAARGAQDAAGARTA